MKEGTDVLYLERRNPQLFLQLAPERVLGAFSRLDVSTWKRDGARYHPLGGLPLLGEHLRLVKDKSGDAFKRLSVFPHAALSPYSLAAER